MRVRTQQSKEPSERAGVSRVRPNTLVQLSERSGVHMDSTHTHLHAQLLSSWGLSPNNNSSCHLFLASLTEYE